MMFGNGTDDREHIKWSEIKKRLKCKSERELLNLLGECYKTSPDIRIILALAVSEGRNENIVILSDLKKRLHSDFWTKGSGGGPKRPNLKEARRVISIAKRSTDNPVELLDLMLCHLEHGVGFAVKYGDMWSGYYGSIESVFEGTCKFILKNRSELDLDSILERIDAQIHRTETMGWGFNENLNEIRNGLLRELEE